MSPLNPLSVAPRPGAAQLRQDRGDQRVVDQLAVRPVPVERVLVVLERAWVARGLDHQGRSVYAPGYAKCIFHECSNSSIAIFNIYWGGWKQNIENKR